MNCNLLNYNINISKELKEPLVNTMIGITIGIIPIIS